MQVPRLPAEAAGVRLRLDAPLHRCLDPPLDVLGPEDLTPHEVLRKVRGHPLRAAVRVDAEGLSGQPGARAVDAHCEGDVGGRVRAGRVAVAAALADVVDPLVAALRVHVKIEVV